MEEEEKAAIDTGESYTYDPQQESGPPAPAPKQQAEASGIPDVGPPPIGEVAQTSVPGGMRKLGAQIGGDIKQGVQNLNQSVPGQVYQRLVSYLMGEGGDHPQLLDQAAQQVDPQGQMSKDDANVLAVAKAAEGGGEQAAWKMMQGHRIAYNGKQAFASAALRGTPQKPPDINAAIDAANQASSHILDGSSIQFAPAQGGVVATIKTPQGQSQQVPLSMQQFGQWLDVGKDGQWDRVMENTAPATLLRLAKGAGGENGGAGGATRLDQMQPLPKPQAPQGAPQQPAPDDGQYKGENDGRVKPAPGTLFSPPRGRPAEKGEPGYSEAARRGTDIVQSMDAPINAAGRNQPGHYPGSGNQPAFKGQHDVNGHWLGPKTGNDPQGYGAQAESRSRAQFPSVGQEGQRQAYMAADEARRDAMANQLGIAEEGGAAKRDVARLTGESRERAQDTRTKGNVEVAGIQSRARSEALQQKALLKLKELESRTHNAQMIENYKTARSLITNINFLTQTQDQQHAILRKFHIPFEETAGGAPPPAGGAKPPPAAGQGQPPEPGAKLYKGTWYRRGPNGESVPIQ